MDKALEMKHLFEIETDNLEILEKFRELAGEHGVTFHEWELVSHDNPSPSGDPYFDNPRNVEEILRRIREMDLGQVQTVSLSGDQRKKLLGL